MFKVVTDQLKVAQGWVRCGYCGEVFDASLRMVTAETALPEPAVPQKSEPCGEEKPASSHLLEGLAETPGDSGAAPHLPATPESRPQADEAQVQQQCPQTDDEEPSSIVAKELAASDACTSAPDAAPVIEYAPQSENPEAQLVEPSLSNDLLKTRNDGWGAGETMATAAPSFPESVQADLPDDQSASRLSRLASLEAEKFQITQLDADDSQIAESQTPDQLSPEATPEVSFVRAARRKAFWKKPLVRGFLSFLSLLLLTALLLQWVLQQKDNLAALDPRLAPFLHALCKPLDCEVRPPRRIESLVIDSSSFSKNGPEVYRLSFVLKNTSATALEVPSLEVTLTDIQEQALVRRVLAPQQFGAGAVTLAAHAELAGAVTLKVSGDRGRDALQSPPDTMPLPVTGYRILAFYP